MFRITVTEVFERVSGTTEAPAEIERFKQTVDTLDVPRIVAMINTRPRQRRSPNKPKLANAA